VKIGSTLDIDGSLARFVKSGQEDRNQQRNNSNNNQQFHERKPTGSMASF
jgi:hypothetical protein